MKKTLIALMTVALVGCSATGSAVQEIEVLSAEEVAQQFEEEAIDIVPEPEPAPEPAYKWELVGASVQEQMALRAFQDLGIDDRLALATLMGNIKQESLFKPDICEGGARVPYEQCFSGGYGLIQWTTANRYRGLGDFCSKYDCNPSTTEGQLRYLFNEYQWIRVEHKFKTPGKTIEWYMDEAAYSWLGWGIHGLRTDYAYDYARWLTPTS